MEMVSTLSDVYLAVDMVMMFRVLEVLLEIVKDPVEMIVRV